MAVRITEGVSLLILLSVVALRPLVAESYDSAGSPFRFAIDAIADPSPLRTLVFDLLILVAAGGWLVARTMQPARRYRRTGLEWGAGLVLIAAVTSCLFAGNKRLAINGAIDWLCYPVLTIALTQLLRQPWHRRLLLAVVIGSGVVQAFRCEEQWRCEFDETWAEYASTKTEFWAQQGVEPDSPRVESFERRLKAREATGGFAHSNIAGSHLLLCAFAALAAALAAWPRAAPTDMLLPAAARLVVAVSLAASVTLTKSLGALLAGLAGVAIWVLVRAMRGSIERHRGRAVLIGWGCVVLGAVTVVAHGIYRDALPGWSLTFRWQYWTASAELIADHPWTGVGRENFDRHYPRYKPITSPEEVANPHNLLVQAAADWGVLGLAGVVVMLVGGSLAVTRPRVTEQHAPPRPPPAPTTGVPPLWVVMLLAVVTIGRIPLLGADQPNFVYYATVSAGLVWLAAAACFAVGIAPGSGRSSFGTPRISTGLACGLFAFLLHDMISFALFVPAAATTFFALLAVCVAERAEDGEYDCPPSTPSRWAPVGAWGITVAAVLWIGVIPVARADRALTLASQTAEILVAGTLSDQPADGHFVRAAGADPLDPTPLVRRAEWLVRDAGRADRPEDALRGAIESMSDAIVRDPHDIGLRNQLMELYRAMAGTTGAPSAYQAAIDAAREAIDLYPLSPRAIAALADRQAEAGEALRSVALLREAVENYRRALALDEQRLSWEELRRFSTPQRTRIQSRMDLANRRIEELSG